ncbi:MAG TPA: hypothetical protein VFP33_12995, partial [Gallionella sp.]|nr:hypothetical protein [Gallionella sp.]
MRATLPAPGSFATPCQSGYFLILSRLVLPALATFLDVLSRGYAMSDQLTHFSESGRARMVDVSEKS